MSITKTINVYIMSAFDEFRCVVDHAFLRVNHLHGVFVDPYSFMHSVRDIHTDD
jgi:hypothetical protein